MAVATATPEQLAQLHNFVQMQRATTIEWFRVMNQIEALILGWNSTILGIIGPPQGTVIHDASSLAGCSGVDRHPNYQSVWYTSADAHGLLHGEQSSRCRAGDWTGQLKC